MAETQSLRFPAPQGYTVPATWFEAKEDARGQTIILMAALGIGARFYNPLAQALRHAGINVLLLEQRGHGESEWRPGRHRDWGFREALLEDLPSAMDWVASRAPGQPIYVMGHSLGGHYAAMATALYPEKIAGVILAACGSPWLGGFDSGTARKLRLLCLLIGPASALFGYYPGNTGFCWKRGAQPDDGLARIGAFGIVSS